MTDYTKTTDFTSKDSLPSGDSGKIIRGAEFGTEFDNIQTAVNSKSNKENPSFTGNITVTGTVDGRDIAADGTKLDTIETSADVTDTANVTAAGAVMDSELTNIAAVKALNQGVATTDSPTFAAVTSTGNVTVGGTVDGRDVAADGTKLDTVETNADVTDTTNVTAAGALMDSEVTNLAQVKAFDSADYATAAQGTTADNALPKTGGAMTGAITTNSTFDGRDVATDGTKLDGIEASADVTDTANVTAAGAVMDSELTDIAAVKALNQGVATTDSPTFAGATVNGTVEFDGLSGTGAVTVTDILDQDDMSSNSATALATQQSIKSYVDSQVATSDTLAEVLANGNATGGTDVAFGDNDKAIFGAGSDLQIYHHPTDGSFIVDNGTGNLQIDASDFRVRKPDGSEAMIHANADGAVKLFYDGGATPKLATISTGIDVTGTLVSDGLTVDGDATIGGASGGKLGIAGQGINALATTTEPSLYRTGSGGSGIFASAGNLVIQPRTSAARSVSIATSSDGASTLERINISSGGDISFYEDTGTTAKLFWDASAESLGIGTSSPSSSYAVDATSGFRSSAAIPNFTLVETDASNQTWQINSTAAKLSFRDLSRAADRIVVDTAGNVGIGTSSPAQALDVVGAIKVSDGILNSGAGGSASIFNEDGTTADFRVESSGNTHMLFVDGGLNKVGIGTSSPETNLHIEDSSSFSIIRLVSSTTENAGIDFGDPDDRDIGRVRYNNSDNSMVFHTNAAERMRIDSSGNVGIGTSSIDLTSSGRTVVQVEGSSNALLNLTDGTSRLYLHQKGGTSGADIWNSANSYMRFATNDTERMRIDSSGNVNIYGTDNRPLAITSFATASAGAGWDLDATSGNGVVTVSTGGTERMRIDSAGNVGIGTSSPSAPLSFGATLPSDGQTIHTYHSGNIRSGLGIVSGVHRLFTDSGSALSFGQVSTSDGSTYTERMRIDSSGHLLVGSTSAANASAGFRAYSGGNGAFTSSATSLSLNRLSSDGEILSFQKDTTSVGSIGSNSGAYLYIASANDVGGIGFYNNSLRPVQSNGNGSDADQDLGNSSTRWRNLYLSSQVYANYIGTLDDTNTTISFPGSDQIRFNNGGSERARIDASGNLLVSKSSLDVATAGLELRADGLLAATRSGTNVAVFRRLSDDGSIVDFQRDSATVGSITADAGSVGIGSGNCGLLFYDAGDRIIPRNGTSTSDGTLDLGATTDRFKDLYLSGNVEMIHSSSGSIQMKRYDSTININNSLGQIVFGGSEDGGTTVNNSASIVALSSQNHTSTSSGGYLTFNTTADNTTTLSERMRLDSSGFLQIGTTGKTGRINLQPNPSNNHFVEFYTTADGKVGEINTTGGTTTNYVTSSDQRLKDNIVDAPSASDDIDAIQVRSFDWKTNGSHQKYGMVAQELNTVAPEAVSAPEDPEEMMGVDYSKLVPMLVKEIQSLRARVAQLETN